MKLEDAKKTGNYTKVAPTPLSQEGVINSPLGWFEVSGHRDVTT